MRSMQRPTHPSFIAIGLVAGALGLMAAGVAVAADTSDAQPSSQTAGTATMHEKAGMSGSNTMTSRMAPTQNTTGSGANPAANKAPQKGANAMSGGSGQMKSGAGSTSMLPRMAPTQNTKGSGRNPKANSLKTKS
ncbi:hypothetical protein [Salinisphaera sp. LB1]|uniref:hypothetical protein n=1 Tax=Salinisphaera sp. LB1 TaxID=2183911 RepID=UPI000D7DE603|nr:hypothetical protein [Salinisphaera sp. LB1]AWN15496.1 hypothetical protein SALB1_1293 [Salinisphaera sp. LB1]